MGDTYQKATGSAGSKGTGFQINLLTLFLLNAFRQNIRGWKLSTENIMAGKFDDVVLEFGGDAILLQAKHKEGKKITLDQLLSTNSKNDDFSLPKYFLSYLNICNNFSVKLVIICTNTQVDVKVLKLVNSNDLNEDCILHYQDGASFFTFGDGIVPELITKTKVYFKNNSKGKGVAESSITEDNAKEFLQHLQLFVNYPSGTDLEKTIEKLLSGAKYFNSSKQLSNLLSGISCRDLHQKMKDWFEQPEGEYLTEIRAKAIFCEIKSEKYREELEEHKLFFKNNDFNIMDSEKRIFHIVADEGHLLHVMRLYRDLQHSKTKTLYMGSDYDRDMSLQTIKAFELPRYIFLIIVSPQFPEVLMNNICDSLEVILKNREYKKVIFVAERDNQLVERISSTFDSDVFNEPLTLEDLSENTQQMLLKRRNIIFQGENVNLGELFPNPTTPDDTKSLNSEIIEKLLKSEKIAVGTFTDLEEGTSKYYINRKFEGVVQKKVYKHKRNKERKQIVCEEDICTIDNKMILISDSAGTGKTTVLKNLALTIKKNSPKSWVIRIELNHYTDILRNSLLNKKPISILELLNYKNLIRSTNKLEKFVFSLKEKVILILDGVDEISPDYTQLILDLLLQIQKAENFKQVFVATRPHVTKELEAHLNIKSFMLVPLTEENQINFFTRYWTCNLKLKDKVSIDKCKLYAEMLLDKVSDWIREWYNEEKFIASPLHATMLAEAFMENKGPENWEGCKEYLGTDKARPKFPETMNIANLYTKFMEKKRDIFIIKGNPIGNTAANPALMDQFEECLAFHRLLALKVILGENGECTFFSCYKQNDRYVDERILLKIGIVQRSHDQLTFVHRTFAEYFVAESIVKELELDSSDVRFQKFLVDEVFIDGKYQIIRHYLNNFLRDRIPSLSSKMFERYMSTVNDSNNSDLIHVLLQEGNHQLIRFILKLIDFNVAEARKGSSLNYFRYFSKKNTLNHLKYNGGIDVKHDGLTPLHCALLSGNFGSVDFLLEMGADVNCKSEVSKEPTESGFKWYRRLKYDDRGNFKIRENHPAAHFAVLHERPDILDLLVDHGADLNIADNEGNTVVHLAAMRNNFVTFRYIANLGVDVCSANKFGRTALHFASEVDSFEMVEFLVEHNANINVADMEGNTALHTACCRNDLKMVRFLINLEADSNIANGKGTTPLHFATLRCNRRMAKFLLKQGAYVDAEDDEGDTALHIAVKSSSYFISELLLKNYASINLANRKGYTAMHYACDDNNQAGSLGMVALLLKHGGDVSIAKDKALHFAVLTNNWDMVKSIAKQGGNVNITDKQGNTALHLAVQTGNYDIIEILIINGVDMNIANKMGETVAHFAAKSGSLETIEYFMEQGVNFKVMNKEGETALQIANKRCDPEIINSLLKQYRC